MHHTQQKKMSITPVKPKSNFVFISFHTPQKNSITRFQKSTSLPAASPLPLQLHPRHNTQDKMTDNTTVSNKQFPNYFTHYLNLGNQQQQQKNIHTTHWTSITIKHQCKSHQTNKPMKRIIKTKKVHCNPKPTKLGFQIKNHTKTPIQLFQHNPKKKQT